MFTSRWLASRGSGGTWNRSINSIGDCSVRVCWFLRFSAVWALPLASLGSGGVLVCARGLIFMKLGRGRLTVGTAGVLSGNNVETMRPLLRGG